MCGIAGLVCLSGACRPDEHVRLVNGLCDLQVHRGPDDRHVVSLPGVCLGVNRLRVIDLTPAGRMPMATEDGRWWIAYNGEVYNFQALREELARAGHAFRSRSDTEVVLRAFGVWGEAALDRFVGMFAFAVYDRRSGVVTLARDRFGKKPLYYLERAGHVLFASEMKALLREAPEVRVDAGRLLEWALYRTVDAGAETLVEGLRALPAGHVLTVDRGGVGPPRRYYAVEAQVDTGARERLARAPAGALAAEVEHRLDEAVRARLVSDVPLGTLCSGGLDSSLVTALAASHRPGLAAFHVAVEGYAALDESPYARAAAAALGVDLYVYRLTADAYRESLVRAVYHSDAPLTHPNSVAFLLVCEFARRRGVTILLSGEGADELFGGYPQRYRRSRQLLRARRLLDRAPARLRKALVLLGAAAAGLPITRFNEYEGLLSYAVALVDRYAREGLARRCADAYGAVADPGQRTVLAAMLADLSLYLAPLLRRLDRMSMAASVECRVPFLDHRLVGLAVNLPLDCRLRGGSDKWLLKVIARRRLPRAVVDRRKVGFPLPVADYLAPLVRPELFRAGFCEDVLGLDRRGLQAAVSGWRQNVDAAFSLLTLEAWGRLFVLREPLDAVTARVLGRAGARAGRARASAVGA